MFERYAEEARRGVFFSRWEAQQQGATYIDWQHLLLGIIHERSSAANETFKLKDQEPTIRGWLPRPPGPSHEGSISLPLSNECKRILAYAAEEAERVSHQYIYSDHLLLGLLREKASSEQLQTLGLKIAGAREAVKTTNIDRTTPPANSYPATASGTDAVSKPTFIQRYALILILIALVVGLIIGVNLNN